MTGFKRQMACTASLLALSASVAWAAGKDENMTQKNFWTVDAGQMGFISEELAITATLPHGFDSLRVKGGEFIQGGKGYGGMVFRKPDGTFVTSFTEISTSYR